MQRSPSGEHFGAKHIARLKASATFPKISLHTLKYLVPLRAAFLPGASRKSRVKRRLT
jgi:hypothetical protein